MKRSHADKAKHAVNTVESFVSTHTHTHTHRQSTIPTDVCYLLHTVIKKGVRRVFFVCEGSVLNERAE